VQINIIISQAVGTSADAAPGIITSLSSWLQSLALQTIVTVSGLKIAQVGIPQVVDLLTASTATTAAGTPLISSAGLLQEILVATSSAAAAAVASGSSSSSSEGSKKDDSSAAVVGIAVAAALAVVSVSAAAAVIVVVKQRARAAAARAENNQGLPKRVSHFLKCIRQPEPSQIDPYKYVQKFMVLRHLSTGSWPALAVRVEAICRHQRVAHQQLIIIHALLLLDIQHTLSSHPAAAQEQPEEQGFLQVPSNDHAHCNTMWPIYNRSSQQPCQPSHSATPWCIIQQPCSAFAFFCCF
jgi:hypothetical protein